MGKIEKHKLEKIKSKRDSVVPLQCYKRRGKKCN